MKYQGFTLFEILIAMAIMMVLLSIAIPSFSSLLKSNRIESQAEQLLASLEFARLSAVKANRRVTICKSKDQISCASEGDWGDGWIAFFDSKVSNAQVDLGESVIDSSKDSLGELMLSASSVFSTALSFRPSGEISGAGGSFIFCEGNKKAHKGHKITVSGVGRSRLEKNAVNC